jgi:ATP-binding cassette subfamily F protein uup
VAEGEGAWREYVGGYSDWERVRPATATSAPKAGKLEARTEAPKETPAAPPAPASKQKKLSYKEQRDLETLPDLMAQLEAEQKNISDQLVDPAIYAQPEEVKRLNQRYADIDAQLLDALERWEAIEARSRA